LGNKVPQPLVQVPVNQAPALWRSALVDVNVDLAAHHRYLTASIDNLVHSGAPASVFDPDSDPGRAGLPDDLGSRLSDALQAYADSCLWAASVLGKACPAS
jgi:hypothetical protein